MPDPSRVYDRIVDHLTYSCYAHNRAMAPEVTPEQWMGVFGERAADFEARYQAEQETKVAGGGSDVAV